MNDYLYLTDDSGRRYNDCPLNQPWPGSVVLANGPHGTAWQRHFSDGLWHSTRGGRPRPWLGLGGVAKMRNLVLIYEADPREVPQEEALV